MLLPSLTRYVLGLAAGVLAVGIFVVARDAHAGMIVQAPKYAGLNTGLVGFWSFDGGTIAGTRVHDQSGQGNHGTMTNGPKLVNGKLGKGMEFDGVDDTVDSNYNGNPSIISISMWIKLSSYGETLNGMALLKNNGGDYWAGVDADGAGPDKGFCFIRTFSAQQGKWCTFTNSIQLGKWYHTVADLYLDGVKVSSVQEGRIPSGTPNTSTGDWMIGGSSIYNFHGVLDDVRIYNRALSPDEIKRLYKIGATAKVGTTISNDSLQRGLVGHWSFDGGTVSGTHVYNQSGNGNRGVMTNGPRLAKGKIGQGMEFDGSDDMVQVKDSASLDLRGPLSYSVWFKLSAGASELQTIISHRDTVITGRPISMFVNNLVSPSTALLEPS